MAFILTKTGASDENTIHFSLVGSKNLLLIFTRNPELGKCKTRLAATIGEEAALNIYKFLLQHTFQITENLNVAKHVYYSETIWNDDLWANDVYAKKLQKGDDLGQRMSNAFTEGFEFGFEKICIIGSDMFDLTQKDLESAFVALDEHDYVVGPAHDGGYYLLGMKKWDSKVFQNKEWGNKSVLGATLADLKDDIVHLMLVRNDVDIYEDIKDVKAFQPYIKHVKND